MISARLQELEKKLLEEKRLSSIWSFFLDHFGANSEFMELGGQTQDAFLEAVLAQVGEQMFPTDGAIGCLLLARIEEKQFVHGTFLMGMRVGGMFYFESLRMGLIAVAENRPSIDVKYARFSGRLLREQPKPSLN